jgi:hypothetical protein
MPYYLAPYVGSGKPAVDPFRPLGSEQPGWAAIDIRPDGGATKDGNGLNACLLYLPQHDPSRRLYRIAEDADEVMGQGLLHRLRHKLGIDPLAGRLRTFVADMMIDPPRNAWKAIRAHRGWYEVYLGGLLCRWPVMAGMTTLTETWTHANTAFSDATSLDADLDWIKMVTDAGWQIQTNQGDFFGDTGSNYARVEQDLATVDMDVQLTLVAQNETATLAIGPAARFSSSVFETNYAFVALWVGSVGTHRLNKIIAGAPPTETDLGSDAQDGTDGETLKVRCSGTSISGYRNGSVLVGPVTDSEIDGVTVGGKRAGMFGFTDGAGVSNAVVDDWSAADLALPSRPMFRGS